jgi:hypothetical protein
MIIYKRNIEKRLLSLRLALLILGGVSLLAFKYHHDNLGYFVTVVIITLSIIVVKDVAISVDSFSVSKYYFFGLVKWTWNFNKDNNIKLSSFGSDFGQDGESSFHDDTGTGIGCLFMIFEVFLPPKIVMKQFKIEKLDNPTKRVDILLDKYEFDNLQQFIKQPQST